VPTLNVSANLVFAEPLSSTLTLRQNNRYEYIRDRQDIGIFDKDLTSSKYELINYNQSTGFERDQNRFTSYIGLSWKIRKLTLGAGVAALWQRIHNDFKSITQPLNMNLFNIVPSANIQWKQFSGNYNMNVSAPQINYLNTVPDSTNPFAVRVGNAYLKPSRQHQFYLSNFNFFQGSGTSYNIWLNGSIIDNDVIMKRTVFANGTQRDSAVNANGSIQFWGGIGFGKEYKNRQKFIFSFRVSPNFSYNQRKLIVNNKESMAKTFGFGPGLNIGLNWNDKVEFRPQYSPRFDRTTYSDASFQNIRAITHYLESELIVRWPKKLVWETNIAYRSINQVSPGLPRTNVLWNAAVTLLMLKGDAGLLKLSVFDILDRNNGLYRYTTQNQIIDNQTNVLQRYGALSFTYNIRNLGAPKKVGGKDRLFFF
jgi:hypothetical protein